MRICFIVGKFPALSETFILNQMTGLMDAGCDIRIFAYERGKDAVVHEDVVRHGLLHHTRYFASMPSWGIARFLKALVLFPLKVIHSPRQVLRSLNVVRFGRKAWSLGLFYKTVMFLEARDHEIVVCHGGEQGILGLQMKEIGVLTGKLVTIFHVEDLTDMVKAMMSEELQYLFAKGDLFLPVSLYARDKLVELGCPQRKIVVHRMGVDVRQFDVTARRRFGSSALKILSVARLIEKKGIVYALEAMALLQDVPYEYVIIGDGPLREQLEAKARDLGLVRLVRFLGAQDSGTVRRYLKDADIFLAPSVTAGSGEKEGVPVVLMEAMASGVPVLTTANGAIRELVQDGRTGFLVFEKDPAALAAKLRVLRHAPGQVESAARAARTLIESQFNIMALNQDLLKLFTNMAYENL
jgi:colanic acid/amylovoran biosynthesis glycosyltransferase